MTRRRIVGTSIVLGLLALGVLALTSLLDSDATDRPPTLDAVGATAPSNAFAQADGPRPFAFPEDHGPHPDYRSEWWYLTGNLQTPNGRAFGYQLTLFRQALVGPDQRPDRRSDWATDQLYMGHFALSDIANRRFHDAERFARSAANVAGAQTGPVEVWLEDWAIEWTPEGNIQARASQAGLDLDLTLAPQKPLVFQGKNGLSQKGPETGNASYYYSYTRLAAEGTLRLNGQEFKLTGTSWLDREFGTSFLSEDQVGWDWFALQLSNGTELMLYRLRKSDGTRSRFSSGTFVDANGGAQHLDAEDFRLESTEHWTSPRSGATYPVAWTISVPDLGVELTIEPKMRDQELSGAFVYWEGAVRASGRTNGESVSGEGYLEMTGYAGSLQGRF